jgi:hypothetical protein
MVFILVWEGTQMSLVKYPAVWETLVGTSLARGGLRSWLEETGSGSAPVYL